MAAINSSPRFVAHENLVRISLYDGVASAVERYLGFNWEGLAGLLTADVLDIETHIVRKQHKVMDATARGLTERVIGGVSIEIKPTDLSSDASRLLDAATHITDVLDICGRAFSQEASGKEINLDEIRRNVFLPEPE